MDLFFSDFHVCDGASFHTQCCCCASGQVLKSEDVSSPCKVLILVFTTVAIFSKVWRLRYTVLSVFLLTVFAIHGMYFGCTLAVPCWLCSASGTLHLLIWFRRMDYLPLFHPNFWMPQTFVPELELKNWIKVRGKWCKPIPRLWIINEKWNLSVSCGY